MKRVAVLAAFQVLVILGWAGQQEAVRATAETFRIPLRPIDPFDVLRGRYFILSPRDGSVGTSAEESMLTAAEVERFLREEEGSAGEEESSASEREASAAGPEAFAGPAQVGFCPEGELQRVCALAAAGADPPPGSARFWSRARVEVFRTGWRYEGGQRIEDPGWTVQIDLGLDRFFLPNRIEVPAAWTDPGWELEVCHRPGLTPLPLRLWYRGRPFWPPL